MVKPKKRTKSYYDFDEVVNHVQSKYGFDMRDFHEFLFADKIKSKNANDRFDYNHKIETEWKIAHNPKWAEYYHDDIGITNAGEANRAEFDAICDAWSEVKEQYELPYLDFWHSMLDHYEIHNGCTIIVNWTEFKECFDKDWEKQICDFFIAEYGNEEQELEIYW